MQLTFKVLVAHFVFLSTDPSWAPNRFERRDDVDMPEVCVSMFLFYKLEQYNKKCLPKYNKA